VFLEGGFPYFTIKYSGHYSIWYTEAMHAWHSIERWKPHIPLVSRYIIAGGIGAVADLGLLFILVRSGVHYLIAATIAFIVATCVSFTMQKFWAFRNRQLERLHVQAPLFLLVAFFNVLMNTLLMYVLVDTFHIWYLGAQVIASGLVAVYSFFVYKFLVFKH
jgi:putative flippase GtrA